MKPRIVAPLVAAAVALFAVAAPSAAHAAGCSVPSNAVWSGSSQFATTSFQSSGATLTLSNNQWGEPTDGSWASTIWQGPNDGNNSWGVCQSAPGSDSKPNYVYPEEMWNAPGTPAISTFPFLTTTYSQTVPSDPDTSGFSAGHFEAAYDMWLDGPAPGQAGFDATPGTEFMIWTDNHGENSGNTDCGNVTIGGITYDLTVAPDQKRIDLLPPQGSYTIGDSGTIDLKGLIQTLASGSVGSSVATECTASHIVGLLGGADPTLTQIDWGFEIHWLASNPQPFYANQFILRDTPTAPTGGGASGSAGTGTVTVSFNPTPASGNGGQPVAVYTVTGTAPGGATVTGQGSSSPITLSGLTPGLTYTFTVSADNSEGAGAPDTFTYAVPAAPSTSPGGSTGSGSTPGGSTGSGATTTTGSGATKAPVCAKPNSVLSSVHVGSITLGESFTHAKKLYPCGSARKTTLSYWFTLTQGGIRVSQPSAAYLKKLTRAEAKKVKSTVILALTWATHYTVDSLKVGSTLKTVEKKLPHGVLLRSGSAEFYFSHTRTRTLVFEIVKSKVAQLGLATPALTTTRTADAAFLKGI